MITKNRRKKPAPYIPLTLEDFSPAELKVLRVYDSLSVPEMHHILTCDCDCYCEVCQKHAKLLRAHSYARAKELKALA
jgi:hypothetical protein